MKIAKEQIVNIVKVVIFFVIMMLIAVITSRITMLWTSNPVISYIIGDLVLAAAVVCLFLIFAIVLDKQPLKRLPLFPSKKRFMKLALGFVIGLAMAFIIYLINVWTGAVVLTKTVDSSVVMTGYIIYLLLSALLVAISIEVAYRGYMLQRLSEALGDLVAAIIISLLLIFSRLTCPFLTLPVLVTVSLLAFFLCYLYFYTKDLYMPIGLHFGWILISKIFFSNQIYKVDYINRFIAGGKGPEEGFPATVILIIANVIIIWLYLKQKKARSEV